MESMAKMESSTYSSARPVNEILSGVILRPVSGTRLTRAVVFVTSNDEQPSILTVNGVFFLLKVFSATPSSASVGVHVADEDVVVLVLVLVLVVVEVLMLLVVVTLLVIELVAEVGEAVVLVL